MDDLSRRAVTFFWERSHPVTGLALDRAPNSADTAVHPEEPQKYTVASQAATGYALCAYAVGAERGWLPRQEAYELVQRKAIATQDFEISGDELAEARARAAAAVTSPRFKRDASGNLVPDVRAAAAIVFNPQTGEVLWEENSHEQRSIASLTKVMTAVTFIAAQTFVNGMGETPEGVRA